ILPLSLPLAIRTHARSSARNQIQLPSNEPQLADLAALRPPNRMRRRRDEILYSTIVLLLTGSNCNARKANDGGQRQAGPSTQSSVLRRRIFPTAGIVKPTRDM